MVHSLSRRPNSVLAVGFALAFLSGCASVQPGAESSPQASSETTSANKAENSASQEASDAAWGSTERAYQEWALEAGRLQPQIKAWAERADYKVRWARNGDYQVSAPVTLRDMGFEEALENVVKSLRGEGASVRMTLFKGNQILLVN